MATRDTPVAPVNLVRSIFLCNIFNFFFSASKACLMPFITVYLKMLGLSATQTGLIIGLKTVVSLVFAPLWARCAVRCGRRRFMLMFSLFIMSATYLSLSAVPSIDEHVFASKCHTSIVNTDFNFSKLPITESKQHLTSKAPVVNSIPTTARPNNSSISQPTVHATEDSGEKPGEPTVAAITTATPRQPSRTDSSMPETTEAPRETTTTTIKPTVAAHISKEDQEIIDILTKVLQAAGISAEDLKGASKTDLEKGLSELLTSKDGEDIVTEALAELPEEDGRKLLEFMAAEAQGGRRRRRESDDESHSQTAAYDADTQSYFTQIFMKIKQIQKHMRDTENQIFVVVMVILMVGEIFCAPVEKIADDGWFEFLETIDDLEKYGMQRIWSTFAFILIPVIVTASVDSTSCVFGMAIHPFNLHFYIFGIMLGITFLLSFYYPMATSDKFKYATKVGKGMRVICGNGRSFMFVMTLLILGVVYASYYNFLFWHLLEMGSKEITLGLCLTMAALSEIPMLLFSEKLVKKIGSGGIVSVSILLVCGRCVYYSFLPTPWAVIPAELTHAFTHTALWWAILSSSSFNSSPALSRSIRSILSTVYFGVGFAVGSIVSGLVYDTYGPEILFQAGAVVAAAWFPFLCMGVRCCREKDKADIKYTRLLTADDASDDSDSMEDDWLEQALKDK